MLDILFVQILNMSFTAGIVILFVLAARLLLKKTPKIFSYALWSVVLFRLVSPFSFESLLSLLPNNAAPISGDILYGQTPQINTGIAGIDNVVNSTLPAPVVGASVNPLQIWTFIGEIVWLVGIAVLLFYSVLSLIRLQNQLKNAVHEKENVYLAEHLATPFVLGIIRPKIYLPATLSREEKQYILLHEQIHIRRFDHVVRVLSFLVLCVHWFNPLVWLAFFLCGKDMEMSCDEAVIKRLGNDVKKDYSSSLLTLATGKRIVSGIPLAFGEGDTRGRIKNVLRFKKPVFWVTVIAVLAVIALCVGLMANPKTSTTFNGLSYRVEEILYEAPMYSFTYTLDTAPQYSISADYVLYSKEPTDEDWVDEDGLYRYKINRQELYALFDPFYNNVHEKIDQVKLMYRADTNDENQTFYLVMQLRNGDVLLAFGYDDPDHPHIRWLFQLENTSKISSEKLWRHRTPYIGNNSEVGGIISELIFPEKLTHDGFELHTSEPPYAVTVKLKTDAETREYYAGGLHQKPFQINACIMFSLIENAQYVNFSLDDGISAPYSMQYTRDWAESIVGANLWDESRTLESFEKLLDRILEHVDSAISSAEEISYTAAVMTEVNGGEEGVSVKIIDRSTVDHLYSLLMLRDEKSVEKSYDDVPKAESYIRIAFQASDGLPYYFVYEKDGSYFEEKPYEGIWEIESGTFKEIVSVMTENNNATEDPAPNIEAEFFNDYPDDYSPEQGEQDGMFVVVHSKTYGDSLNVLEQFLAQTENKEPANIKILQYTTEGDPILTHVIYDATGYQVLTDSSRDKFGSEDTKQTRVAVADYLTVFSDVDMTYIYLTDSESITLEYAQSDGKEYGLAQLVAVYEN